MREFFIVFVPLFVAVDALGILPVYMGLVEGVPEPERRRITQQSFITALVVAVGFIFLGQSIFSLLGITVSDFLVAGGTILFLIASINIISTQRYTRQIETLGAVPIGVPLIVGPAVLTTSLVLASSHGVLITVLAVIVNITLAEIILLTGGFWSRLLGQAGSQAVTKVASLILASIGVMMVRKGLLQIFDAFSS